MTHLEPNTWDVDFTITEIALIEVPLIVQGLETVRHRPLVATMGVQVLVLRR
jgi:hypothetical protein